MLLVIYHQLEIYFNSKVTIRDRPNLRISEATQLILQTIDNILEFVV